MAHWRNSSVDIASLPIHSELDRIVEAACSGALVLSAPPGSGKSTLVAPALAAAVSPAEQVYLLQPRRVAARSVARRIANLQGVELGAQIGYQVRFEDRTSRQTQLIVATTGIFLRRLADDLSLPGVAAVILDEFHERSIEIDLVLGMLCRLQQTIRPDLKVVVMSATVEPAPIARLLGDATQLEVPGRVFPVEVRYRPGNKLVPLEKQVGSVVQEALDQTDGHLLVFLPGVGEIRKCHRELEHTATRHELKLLDLYGDLPLDEQDQVLAQTPQRKLILATNVAETSLTIEGVTAVIDSGLARQMRVHPAVGLPRLELVPISKASAEQRAGRAGRLMPGICWRLWAAAAHAARAEFDPPEALRGDLAGALLQLIHWGESETSSFPWLDSPSKDAMEQAWDQLRWLGAVDESRKLTGIGLRMIRIPAHPRLARLVLAGADRGVGHEAAVAAAILTERDPFRSGPSRQVSDRSAVRSRCDVADRVHWLAADPDGRERPVQPTTARAIERAANQYRRLVADRASTRAADIAESLGRSLLDAFPDRLAQLRTGSTDRGVMVGGRGVRIDPQSNVRPQRLFLAIDVADRSGDALVRMATAVDREWLDPALLRQSEETYFHPSRRQIEIRRRVYWGDLLLEESPAPFQASDETAALLARHAAADLWRVQPPEDSSAGQFRQRVNWLIGVAPDLAIPPLDDEAVKNRLHELCGDLRSLDELQAADWLSLFKSLIGWDRAPEIDRLAPERIEVPSGNRIALQYNAGKAPVLAVRIQEVFGLKETPRIAGGRVGVLMHLLGPNYRPQQITDDLSSFWKNGYPVIRKELKRRYPKHSWPEDPLSAQPLRSGLRRDQKLSDKADR